MLWSRAIKLSASSNKRKRNLPRDEDISRVLDIEDESAVFSGESDDFWFDTSEEDTDRDSDTSSVVHESEPSEEVSDFSQPFVPHGVVCPRFAFLNVSAVNVDFDDEINVLDCFQKFIDEDMWHLFAEQTNIYANQFLAGNPNLKPQSRVRSWVVTNPTEMKTLIGLLILQGTVQKPENGMYFSKRVSHFGSGWEVFVQHFVWKGGTRQVGFSSTLKRTRVATQSHLLPSP
jgi:hypothetical protein